ncbi:hypothetical protein GGR54DRAFT_651815 [Hypoxylon sp. NC1633]|nr:hypothetical protein GGR54DRAFT_651815 [Hypoxylon sp. NC1633]
MEPTALFAKRQNAASPSADADSWTLTTGAIVGIAIGGAALLFSAFAFVLVKVAKRQDRRRASTYPESSVESGTVETGPKRLRKKSIVADPVSSVVVVDKEDKVGREESRSRHSSVHNTSPAKTRPGSVSRSSFGGGSGRGSTDTQQAQGPHQIQNQKQRSPEKQRGYGLYQHRRKTSWIDEDALHGPTVTSPKKAKQKHRRRVSWFDGGLGRSLSRLSTRSGMGEASPTLPYTEDEGGEGKFETPTTEGVGENDVKEGMPFTGYVATPRTRPQRQQQGYTSPQKSYVPSPSSVSSNVAKSPPDIIHNPRYRNQVSFQAAQQLAGAARLPPSLGIPQPQVHLQAQRHPILKHSATDTDLTEILRMTAERLQDGHRSSRRQTLMVPYHSGRMGDEGRGGYHGYEQGSEPPCSGDVSPVKSHKSAPATLTYAELEGSSPQKQVAPRQMQTPRHSRHISHMSQISMISEPESLVASKRESVQEVRTALSSPSRVARSAEPTPSPQSASQQARPFSYGSSMSSALSTLYSMEEASVRSPPIGDQSTSIDSGEATDTPRLNKKTLSAFNMLNASRGPDAEAQKSPKFRFDDGEKPPPLRIHRGTLGAAAAHNSLPVYRSASHRSAGSTDRSKHRSAITIGASPAGEDPFTVATPPQNPARLSKVFSPLPAGLPPKGTDPQRADRDKASTSLETPTPSPTRRGLVMRSPRTILYSPSRHEMERAGSPVVSEAGLSSVYDSYAYNRSEAYAETASDSTATLTTVPTAESESDATTTPPAKMKGSTGDAHAHAPGSSGRESRIGFRIPDYLQPGGSGVTATRLADLDLDPVARAPPSPSSPLPLPRRSMPSDGSVYSQDQNGHGHGHGEGDGDSVPPMRAPTVRRGKSVRLSNAITELRRMNSQISTVSEASVASSTVVGMRGGGSSPGRHGGGGKNYLSLGGALNSSGDPDGSAGSAKALVKPGSPTRRGNVRAARRGTVVLQGLDARRLEPNGPREQPKEGGAYVRAGGIRHSGSPVAKLRREEVASKRVSVESLYDAEGFLKSQL